jgi:hypothetical protein
MEDTAEEVESILLSLFFYRFKRSISLILFFKTAFVVDEVSNIIKEVLIKSCTYLITLSIL